MNKEHENTDLITVAVVSQLHEASLLQSVLEKEGIVVFLQNEMMAQIYGNVTGGIEIQVPAMDAEKAHNLLLEAGYIK